MTPKAQIYFFKAIKNQAGYYLYGNPPRWHKFDASNPAPADAHKVVDHKAHVAAIEKLKDKHHADPSMSAEDMANEVHAEGEKIAAYKNAIARANDVKKKLLAGKNPQKNEVIWFWKAPEQKRQEVIDALLSSGNQFAIDGINKIIAEHGGQAEPAPAAAPAPAPVAEKPQKTEEPTFAQKLKDLNGDELGALDAADAYVAKNGKSAKTYQEIGQAMDGAGFNGLSAKYANLSQMMKEGEATPAKTETFTNDKDGTQSQVSPHASGGWSVSLKDNDSGETMPTVKIFPSDKKDDAVAYAKKIVGEKQDAGWKPSYEDVMSLMTASQGDKIAKMQEWSNKMGGMSKLVDVIKEYQAQATAKDGEPAKEPKTIFAKKVEKMDFAPGDEIKGNEIKNLPAGSVIDAGDGTHKILVGRNGLWFNNKTSAKSGKLVWQSKQLAPQHMTGVFNDAYGKMKVDSLGGDSWVSDAQKKTIDAVLPAIKDNYPDAQSFVLGHQLVIGSPGNENSFKWFAEDGSFGVGFTGSQKAKIKQGDMTPISLGEDVANNDDSPKEGDTKTENGKTYVLQGGRWHLQGEDQAKLDWQAKMTDLPVVGLNGKQYYLLSEGANDGEKTYVHLASVDEGKTQANGWNPKQVATHIPNETLDAAKQAKAPKGPVSNDWAVSEHIHSKNGESMPKVAIPQSVGKMDDAQYKAVASSAKSHGGWWSKIANGFLFKTPEDAKAFSDEMNTGAPAPTKVDDTNKVWLHVPYAQKNYAKSEGAKWDKEKKLWYAIPTGHGNGPHGISINLSSFVPDGKSIITNKEKMQAAAMNLSKQTGKDYEVHSATSPDTGVTGYYVATPDGVAVDDYAESGIKDWQKHGAVDKAPTQSDEPKATEAFPVTASGYLANKDGNIQQYANLKQANLKAKTMEDAGYTVHVTAAHPFKIVVDSKPGEEGSNSEPEEIKDSFVITGVPSYPDDKFQKVDGSWYLIGKDGSKIPLAHAPSKQAAEKYLQEHPGFVNKNPGGGKSAWDAKMGQSGSESSNSEPKSVSPKLAMADGEFPHVSTSLIASAYEKIDAVKEAAKAGDIDKVESLTKQYLSADPDTSNSSTKFAKIVLSKMKEKAGTAGDGPKEGDTKVVNGVTYQLINGRWHKVNTMGSTDSQVIKLDDTPDFKFKKMDGEWHFADNLENAKWTKLTHSEKLVKELEAKLAESQIVKLDDHKSLKFKKEGGKWHMASDYDGAMWNEIINNPGLEAKLEAKIKADQAQAEPKAGPTSIDALEVPDMSGAANGLGWTKFMNGLKEAVAKDPANIGMTVNKKRITITNKKTGTVGKVINPLYLNNLNDKDKARLQFLFSLKSLAGSSIHSGVTAWLEEQGYPVAMPTGKKAKKSKPKVVFTKPAEVAAPKVKQVGKVFATVMDDWQKVGDQAGSNNGGKFRDKSGQDWYCKFPSDEDVVKNEFLASKFYEMLGSSVPKLKLVEKDGKLGIASQWVDGLTKGTPESLAKAGAHEGFVFDAWLANWDVVGLGFDNLLVGPDGKAVRVDAGGSLVYRAQGGKKGDDFGSDVKELDSLIDPSMNANSASVFGLISKEDLLAGANQLAKMHPNQIKKMCNMLGPGTRDEQDALAQKLVARREFILKKLGVVDPWNAPEVDTTKLVVDPNDLPSPIDFFSIGNQGPTGKWVSGSEFYNKQNSKDSADLVAFAAKGNLKALQEYEYDAVNKETGDVIGKKSIAEHPSKHIKDQWASLCDLLTSIAHPPVDGLELPPIGGGSADEVSLAAGYFKPGENINTISKEKVLGFWMKLGHVGADSVADLVPNKTTYFTKSVMEKSKGWFNSCKSATRAIISAIQGSGQHNRYWNNGAKQIDISGYHGPAQNLAMNCYGDANEQEEGTRIHRWMNMTQAMMDQLVKEGPGLVFQNADSMCCSVIKDWGDQSHFGSGAFLNITYAKGAKALESLGSGSFKATKFDKDGHPLFTSGAEAEVTTLMGQRFVVLGVKKGNASSSNGITLDLLMLPPHEGYTADLKEMAAMGKSMILFFTRQVMTKGVAA